MDPSQNTAESVPRFPPLHFLTGNATELTFSDWRHFVSAISRYDLSHWVFRGQPRWSMSLSTRLERELRGAGVPPNEWPEREQASIEHFKIRALRLQHPHPNEEDFAGWLGLMQHYGGATRLLDWSRSPFVATYFAFADSLGNLPSSDGDDDGAAALWGLNTTFCASMFGYRLGKTGQYETWDRQVTNMSELVARVLEAKEEVPLPLVPLQLDPRMLVQQSVLTLDASLSSMARELPTIKFWRWPSGYHNSNPWDNVLHGSVIFRIKLKPEWRNEALSLLQLMNISPDSLFPNLDGVGTSSRLQLHAPVRRTYAGVLVGKDGNPGYYYQKHLLSAEPDFGLEVLQSGGYVKVPLST